MIGGPTTTNNQYRIFRGIPATLGGAAGLVANDALVTASRSDPWIQAASTGTSSPLVPAFIRVGAVVSFDFYLCSGNGARVPSDCVELIFTNGVASPAGTTIAVTGVTAGSRLLDEPIATTLVADNSALVQDGRRVIIQADATGRVTGSITMTTDGNCPVIIKYRHIITLATALIAAS